MEVIYIICIILLLIYLEKWFYQKNAFKKFDYDCAFDVQEAMEGEEIKLVETVTNRKLLPLPWLRSELTTSAWLDYAGGQSIVTDGTRFVPSFFALKGLSRTTRSWNVRCCKRGVYTIDKCVLLSTDLFGLKSFSYPVHTAAQVTVLPKPAPLQESFTSAKRLTGDILVRRHYIEDPFYIAGVREYTERDTLNRIHWPATARMGRLMVHNNQYTVEQNLLVVLNLQSRKYESGEIIDKNKAETAIRIAAGFLEDTLRSGLPVRLAVNAAADGRSDYTISNEFNGVEHVHELMRILAELPLKTTMPFDNFLVDGCEKLESSDIIIASPFLDDAILTFARERQEQGAQVKIALSVHPEEGEIPDDVPVFVYTGEEEFYAE